MGKRWTSATNLVLGHQNVSNLVSVMSVLGLVNSNASGAFIGINSTTVSAIGNCNNLNE